MKNLLLLVVLCTVVNNLYAQPSDNYLKSMLDAEKIPGAAMVVVGKDKWILEKSLGKANLAKNIDVNRRQPFLLSSASNIMVTTAVMQLWEKGKLSLDVNVNNYLPFQLVNPYYSTDSITLKMLLTHTASIEDNYPLMNALTGDGDCPVSLDSFTRNYFKPGGIYYSMSGNFYTYPPGAQWQFSNMGMVLASYIVERVTGDAFSHYCDTAIFEKLCMDNTAYDLAAFPDTNAIARPYSWDGNSYSDNGLYGCPGYPAIMLRSSSTSMARFIAMYLGYGRYNDARILDSTTVVKMMQPYTPSLMAQTQALLFQGLGFYTRVANNGDTVWGQEGGLWGAAAAMYFNYPKNTGVLMLMNGEGTNNPMLIMDTLYKYGVTVVPGANDTFPACDETTSVTPVMANRHEVLLYPNPSQGDVSIVVDVDGDMVLANAQGQVKYRHQLIKGRNAVGVYDLSPGVYFVYILDDKGKQIAVRKLVLTQ